LRMPSLIDVDQKLTRLLFHLGGVCGSDLGFSRTV
jgi:hypothetical protein